jgi:hypothetical protein
MQRLGGKDLDTKQIRQQYYEIHFQHLPEEAMQQYSELRTIRTCRDARSYNSALKSTIKNGLVTRKLVLTESANYTTCMRFLYSLV